MSEEAANTGDGQSEPQGKLMRAVYAFKALMGALRGGGVWAALTVLLMTCGWLAWELRAANERIIDILMAIKMTPPPATAPVTPAPSSHAPPDFHPSTFEGPLDPTLAPRAVLDHYNKMYRPQLEQRMSPREGQVN